MSNQTVARAGTAAEIMPEQFPRRAVAVVALGLLIAMIFAAGARLTGYGVTRFVPPVTIETRDLRFDDMAGGAVAVYDATSGDLAGTLPADAHGFIKVLLRGFARDRMLAGIPAEAPFRLGRGADGRTYVQDPSTGRVVMLAAFGSSNANAFEPLFRIGRIQK